MHYIGRSFTVLQSVDSTNNYAMAQAHTGLATHGSAYFALEQTAGRGRRGRLWQSNAGQNIALSVILEPALLITDQFVLSMAIALGCYDFVKVHAGNDTRIKWPNDIYWRDRKAGGILIENSIMGSHWQYAIAGIGINVNQTGFPNNLANPVSLKQISGKTADIILLAKQLCGYLQLRFQQLEQKEEAGLLAAYHAALYKCNETIWLRRNNIVFETQVKGVTRQGQLITRNAIEQQFSPEEVEWVK